MGRTALVASVAFPSLLRWSIKCAHSSCSKLNVHLSSLFKNRGLFYELGKQSAKQAVQGGLGELLPSQMQRRPRHTDIEEKNTNFLKKLLFYCIPSAPRIDWLLFDFGDDMANTRPNASVAWVLST